MCNALEQRVNIFILRFVTSKTVGLKTMGMQFGTALIYNFFNESL